MSIVRNTPQRLGTRVDAYGVIHLITNNGKRLCQASELLFWVASKVTLLPDIVPTCFWCIAEMDTR